MSVFYIVIEDDGKKKAIISSSDHVREFSKHKKARNFIEGRRYLADKSPEIVTDIDEIKYYFKVDI